MGLYLVIRRFYVQIGFPSLTNFIFNYSAQFFECVRSHMHGNHQLEYDQQDSIELNKLTKDILTEFDLANSPGGALA